MSIERTDGLFRDATSLIPAADHGRQLFDNIICARFHGAVCSRGPAGTAREPDRQVRDPDTEIPLRCRRLERTVPDDYTSVVIGGLRLDVKLTEVSVRFQSGTPRTGAVVPIRE